MDSGLEQFIAARRTEGFAYVVVSHDGMCCGWGKTPDQAWHMAAFFSHNRRYPGYLGDAKLYDSAPRGAKLEDWDSYEQRVESGDRP